MSHVLDYQRDIVNKLYTGASAVAYLKPLPSDFVEDHGDHFIVVVEIASLYDVLYNMEMFDISSGICVPCEFSIDDQIFIGNCIPNFLIQKQKLYARITYPKLTSPIFMLQHEGIMLDSEIKNNLHQCDIVNIYNCNYTDGCIMSDKQITYARNIIICNKVNGEYRLKLPNYYQSIYNVSMRSASGVFTVVIWNGDDMFVGMTREDAIELKLASFNNFNDNILTNTCNNIIIDVETLSVDSGVYMQFNFTIKNYHRKRKIDASIVL
jgi:hypothetical protein